MKRIDKMVAIKNDKMYKRLEIEYRDGDKKVKVKKGYGRIPLSEAIDYVKSQQKILKQKLILI